MIIDTKKMFKIEEMSSLPLEYLNELMILADRAKEFLESQEWCKRITEGMFDRGWGHVLGIFYFRFEPTMVDVPDHTWVIVGDIPSAYIYADDNPNGACALEAYVTEMERWVGHVVNCESVEDDIPVNAPPTRINAEDLQGRLNRIKEDILSYCVDEIEEGLQLVLNEHTR